MKFILRLDDLPPSVNLSHRYGAKRVFLSKKTLDFRKKVRTAWESAKQEPLRGRLGFRYKTCSRSRRRHDLDNVLKSIWDALERAGCYKDDSAFELLFGQKCWCRLCPSAFECVVAELEQHPDLPALTNVII